MTRLTVRHPATRSRMRAGRSALCVAVLLAVALPRMTRAETDAERAARHARILEAMPAERVDDAPGVPAPVSGATRGVSPASTIVFGRFKHVQANVNGAGVNVLGDAANEPSITVDPTNHNHMAIGWRQFDTVSSNFRQAGYANTTDGGATWSATGRLEPGVFRSDPVLESDAAGKFFYNSLTSTSTINSWVFPSTNGGATWGTKVFGYGGDKQWMAIDRTGSSNRIYQAWSTAGNSYFPNTFTLSEDHGASFVGPLFLKDTEIWGTLDVASDGTLYVVGTDLDSVFVSRSTDAKSTLGAPTFSYSVVDMGGFINTGGPNPDGLDGQLWIAVDRSGGPRNGWIYVLGSLTTPTDPLDVMFSRSTDGGLTWSAPVRVNDDPVSSKAWQWFGTMSVSPNGRIDAVWNDSRLTGDSTRVALFYSYSDDGGVTWSANEQASPVWDAKLGYPNQNKIGDYYTMVSDVDGADLAWAATFNGEEDVYYTRIPHQTTAVMPTTTRVSRLHSAAPDPFTTTTTIRYDVPSPGARVRLEVFDAAGHRVATLADGFRAGGPQVASWDGLDASGRAVTSGLYFCRYRGAGVDETLKLMRLR